MKSVFLRIPHVIVNAPVAMIVNLLYAIRLKVLPSGKTLKMHRITRTAYGKMMKMNGLTRKAFSKLPCIR